MIATGLLVAMSSGLHYGDKDFLEPHSEVQIPVQASTLTRAVSTANTSPVMVTYSTPCFLHQNNGVPGRLSQEEFATISDAKEAALPADCTFARFPVDEGYFVFSPRFGWEFFQNT
jgi:hypothetical protein